MSGLKSLNTRTKKINQKAKSTAQRETFFGKTTEAAEQQYQTDSLQDTGPYLAKVLVVYNEEGGGKVLHNSTFGGVMSAIGNFLGLSGEVSNEVLTVKARLIDAFDTAIPEPKLIGKAAYSNPSDGGESAALIELHDTFTALTVESNRLSLKSGDIIVVDYRDKKNKKNGYIIGKYFSCETAAEAAAAAGTAAASVAISAGGPSARYSPGQAVEGRCGYDFIEVDCVRGLSLTGSAEFGPYNNTELQAIKAKLEVLKNYKYNAITFYGGVRGQSAVADGKGGVIAGTEKTWLQVNYDWTKTGKFTGHPDFYVLLKKMCERVLSHYKSLNDPITPSAMTNNGVYVGIQGGIAKRKRNCPGLSDAEVFTAPYNDPRCKLDTCPPGRGMHCRGEAIDITFFDLDKFARDGYKIAKSDSESHILGVSMSKENYKKHEAHPLRAFILTQTEYDLSGETLVTPNVTKQKLLPLSSEGWHFSTTGW